MKKTATALLAAASVALGLGALAERPGSSLGLAFAAAALFAGWMALASRPLGRELAAAIAFFLRGPSRSR
jgi:hypothetical protein